VKKDSHLTRYFSVPVVDGLTTAQAGNVSSRASPPVDWFATISPFYVQIAAIMRNQQTMKPRLCWPAEAGAGPVSMQPALQSGAPLVA